MLKEKENQRRADRYYEELREGILELYEESFEKIKKRKKDQEIRVMKTNLQYNKVFQQDQGQ